MIRSATAVIVVIIHTTATIATAVTATAGIIATVGVATAIEQKEYDDENPDDIIVIKNIAKTIHKYPPFAVRRRRYCS